MPCITDTSIPTYASVYICIVICVRDYIASTFITGRRISIFSFNNPLKRSLAIRHMASEGDEITSGGTEEYMHVSMYIVYRGYVMVEGPFYITLMFSLSSLIWSGNSQCPGCGSVQWMSVLVTAHAHQPPGIIEWWANVPFSPRVAFIVHVPRAILQYILCMCTHNIDIYVWTNIVLFLCALMWKA